MRRLTVYGIEICVVASVIEQVNPMLGVKSLTPKEHADILKALDLSAKVTGLNAATGMFTSSRSAGAQWRRASVPECAEVIGGGQHRLAEGNYLAPEMDGASHAAWSERANLLNYDLDALRRFQR